MIEFRRSPNGFIHYEDFEKLNWACYVLGRAIYNNPPVGEIIDGIEYVPIDLLEDLKDIKEAMKIFQAYFKFEKEEPGS